MLSLKFKIAFLACFTFLLCHSQMIKMRFTYNDLPVINTKINCAGQFFKLTDPNGEILVLKPKSPQIYYTIDGRFLNFGSVNGWHLDSIRFDKDTVIHLELEKELPKKRSNNINNNLYPDGGLGLHQISLENKKYTAFREYLKTHNYLLASMNEEDFMFSISKEEQIQLKKDIEVDLLIQKSKLDSLTKLQEKLQTKKIDDTYLTLISTQIEATTLLIEKRELEIEKLEEKFKEVEIKKPVKKTQAKKSTQVVALKPPIIGPPTIGLKALGMEIVDLNHTIAALEYKLETEKNKSIEPEIKLEQHFEFVEEVAVFHGGNDSLKIWWKNNIRYPQKIQDSLEFLSTTKVYVKFIVEVDGTISLVSVYKGIPECFACDEEAIRLVSSMPKWIAGKDNKGKVVRTLNIIQLNFYPD